jgi:hypothetical protein
VVLGFKHRVFHLLGRNCNTWTTLPVKVWNLDCDPEFLKVVVTLMYLFSWLLFECNISLNLSSIGDNTFPSPSLPIIFLFDLLSFSYLEFLGYFLESKYLYWISHPYCRLSHPFLGLTSLLHVVFVILF